MTVIQRQYARATRQMRGFILVWTFVTLVMGLATFMAIYFTYTPPGGDDEDTTLVSQGGAQAVVLASSTPLPSPTPTNTPVATNTPLPEPTTVAQLAPTNTPIPTIQPTVPPALDKRFAMGIQVQYSLDLNPANQDGFYQTVYNDMSLRWVKHQVRWENLEPERGQFDWSTLDIAMTSAKKFGIKMMLSIVTAPDWSRESGVNTSRHGPPANNADYVNFVTQILKRYPGQVHAMEIWNEMNLDREWTSTKGLSANNYTALLRDTYNAVKAIDPGVIVISGALSPTGVDDGIGAIDDFRYTDLLIQAGALDYMDCYGAHHNGYNMPPLIRYNDGYQDASATFRGPFDNPHHSWSFRSTLEGYAQRIRNSGKDIKLCITEFGWPVTEDLSGSPEGFGFANDNTLAEQENWMRDAMSFMEESGFVWLAFIWNFNYGPQAGWDPKNDNVPYSLIGPDMTFRPAFHTISGWQWDYLLRTDQAEQ
jgi:polysaccharide biosynthesis protein PslG